MREITQIIDSSRDGKAVGDVLKKHMGISSRQLTALKKSSGILVDGKPVTVRQTLSFGQVLTLVFNDDSSSENIVPIDIPLDILYEDSDLLAVSKPKDMPVHPSAHNYDNTLGNACMYYYRNQSFVFRPITRLDRDTTGVVIIAKNKLAANKLSQQMQNGGIKKTYLALLSKAPSEKKGIINAPIARCDGSIIKRCVSTNGKPATTIYEVISTRTNGTCVALVNPVTGRTHQIRVHMAHIGCPLLYDYMYGEEIEGKTLFLHCASVCLTHPITGKEMIITSPVSEDSELSDKLS